MSKGKEMRRLADDIMSRVSPVTSSSASPRTSSTPSYDDLFASLVEIVSEKRGRRVVLCREVFPPHTASGLWLDLETHDVIVVERRAASWHQLVIFFHEVWHMLKDDCDLHVAARTAFSTHAEQEAERFGLLMGGRLRTWLQETTDGPRSQASTAGSDIAARIEAVLSHRGPRA